ncbi:MAG: NADH-quinone oxidoreductase subunit A [Candidatus Melainabacteria bacterium]|nr:NADH-quinone oxidoreductase subunit A [Candidatus Melainabacteria bacterium]
MYELQLTQIVIFVFAGFALPALGMILLAWILQNVLGYHQPNAMKNQPYECGMKPLQEALIQFEIRYYLYALLFILFDIEIIFIIPWALATDTLPSIVSGDEALWLGPVEMLIFLTILAVGLAYAWKKGALEWEN